MNSNISTDILTKRYVVWETNILDRRRSNLAVGSFDSLRDAFDAVFHANKSRGKHSALEYFLTDERN